MSVTNIFLLFAGKDNGIEDQLSGEQPICMNSLKEI